MDAEQGEDKGLLAACWKNLVSLPHSMTDIVYIREEEGTKTVTLRLKRSLWILCSIFEDIQWWGNNICTMGDIASKHLYLLI